MSREPSTVPSLLFTLHSSLLAVHQLLEPFPSPERRHCAGLDIDAFAGLRVPASTRGSATDLKVSEAGDLYLVALP